MPLPQMPFGLRMPLPGTDGFSLPQGSVPGGPMPAPLPDGMGQEAEAFSFQPPPVLPSPPVPAPEGQQTSSAMAGQQQPSPGNSDKKGGLSTWLPLILGTLGAGAWAAKEKSFTDFGVNLLQGAVDQSFKQSEEKRQRNFELESADLKQGYEVIKDLMAIDEGSLDGLENEIRNNPAFSHLAAYIGPLREAKAKYRDVTATGSDGGMKITAKEAASLAHYYNAVKGAKEFINKFNEQKQTTGFAGQKAGAEESARRKTIEEAYLAAGGTDPSKLYRIYGPNARELSPKQLQDNMRLAQWFAAETKNPDWESVHASPLAMKRAEMLWSQQTAGGNAKARAENTPASFAFQFVAPPGEAPFLAGVNRRDPSEITKVDFGGGATRFEKVPASESAPISGMHTVAQAYEKLNDIASKHPTLFSLQGKFANWDLNKLGGYLTQATNALSPEEIKLAAELKNANILKMFSEGGKNLTGTEKELVGSLLVQPGDSLAKALGNSAAFLSQYGNYLQNKRSVYPQADPTIFTPRTKAPTTEAEKAVVSGFAKKYGRPPSAAEMQEIRAALKRAGK